MAEEKEILYHGSNTIVDKPVIQISGYYKDFGYGFYCTRMEKQAVRWALTKRGEHIVNSYVYKADPSLRVQTFEKMTDPWLDFVVDCRRGIPHDYDIVEGPMADDQIWDYVEDYMDGTISREAFWELAKFKYPTHQIVFCTGKALNTLTFKEFKRHDE